MAGFKRNRGQTSPEYAHHINSIAEQGDTVFILSRYRFLFPDEIGLIKKDFDHLNIETNLTMHGSKGKEAEYVIIIGVKNGSHGFPSEKATHPLLEVYLPDEEQFPYAEERRLFYVALTRAKHKVVVLVDMSQPSVFALELINQNYDVCLDEFEVSGDQERCREIACPECKSGRLVIRNSEYGAFTACSNYPYCGFTQDNCNQCDGRLIDNNDYKICESDECGIKIPKCPQCSSVLIRRKNSSRGNLFWGCRNYNSNQNYSCKYTAKIEVH